jgi:hypothetical protein
MILPLHSNPTHKHNHELKTCSCPARPVFLVRQPGLGASADGRQIVAVAQDSRIHSFATSTAPGDHGTIAGEQGSAIELQHLGNGTFLPLSHEGTINVQ